jgi:hypothetical protein
MASTTFSGPVTSTNGFIGAVTGNITGNITGDVIATNQALSGAGAVNITDMLTSLTTTGAAQALTLANGTLGQIKIISHKEKNDWSLVTKYNIGKKRRED